MRRFLLLACGIGLLSVAANADLITPTDNIDLGSLTFDESISGVLTAATFTADYVTAVYTGGLCADCMTFAYEVTNTAGSADGIEQITATDFTGYTGTAVVAYGDDTVNPIWSTPGTQDPGEVDITADTIDWSYIGDALAPGSTTPILVIETDATTVSSGGLLLQDGSNIQGAAFDPAPEPATDAMMGGALIALSLLARRFRKA